MRRKTFILIFLIGLFLVACQTERRSSPVTTLPQAPTTHPELSEEEKLVPCAQCHQEVTPKIYQEWFESRHGLDNVKCFQCHGTYENFELEPSENRCAACHAREVAHAPKTRKCWACHPAHKFTVHQ